MRTGLLTITLTAVALLAAERPAEARNTCPQPRGYTQVAVSGEARVFERGDTAYGCHVSTRRVVPLGIEGWDYRLAGKYVARWWVFCCDASDPPESTIAVSSLRSGEFGRVHDIWDGPQEDGGEAHVTSFVVTRAGRLAWIACMPTTSDGGRCVKGPSAEYRVWRSDRRGVQMLDEADGVELRSLRRDGSTLTWRHGDEPRTATIK